MKRIFLVCLLLLPVCGLSGQGTFDYGDIASGKFTQKSVSGLRPDGGEHYTVVEDNRIIRYEYLSGQVSDTVCDITACLDLLEERHGEDFKRRGASLRFDGYQLSGDRSLVLLKLGSRPVYRRSSLSSYAVYDVRSGEVTLHPQLMGDVRYAVLSPGGDRLAYVRENDIYYTDTETGLETRVTSDGKENHIINGIPDWVYEEEFGLTHALRWSPDGKRIAFLRFDEELVRSYSINYFVGGEPGGPGSGEPGSAGPLYPYTYTFKYPKAGERNSLITLHVHDVQQGLTVEVDTGSETDRYIPHFDWTASGELYHFRLNRLQNHLTVYSGYGQQATLIYEERSPMYIDDVGPSTITFLPDSDRFIVRNETRTGYWHLYMYSVRKGFQYPITKGEWEVKELVGMSAERIWYISNETSPLRTNLYSSTLEGKGRKRLTPQAGTYRIAPSDGVGYYISYFSNASTPNTVTLHSGDGKLIRLLEDNTSLKEYISDIELPRKEFFVFRREADGQQTDFNCYMIRPRDFDPGRSYPLLVTQYSGPGSQQVADRWQIGWEDALVQQGYIVACMDPRGTGNRGEAFKKLTYGRMGMLETEDQIAFAREMAARPFVDPGRVGIYGWSYGGFMSLNCILKGADIFRMAIAVAPVTSWRFYDSIYTERYNGLPQDNPAGYDDPSPITHASLLKGRLLLIHGSADDNVHVQNSYRMAYELVRGGKQFDMMIYPDDNHSMVPSGRHNVREKMILYCLENL